MRFQTESRIGLASFWKKRKLIKAAYHILDAQTEM
jgi:hypothetical protein